MIGFLRFVGILNAAIWCGSSIFLMIGLPAIFSPELKKLLTPQGVGFAAQDIVARYFWVQYVCGSVALLHLLAEWVYCGKPIRRFNVVLASGMLALALLGGLWLQPKMRAWHMAKYFGTTADLQARAAQSFARWHAVSESANLLVAVGLVIYLWRVSMVPETPRFGGFATNPGLTKERL